MEELLSTIQGFGRVRKVEADGKRLRVLLATRSLERVHGLLTGFLRRNPDVSALVIPGPAEEHELSIRIVRRGRVFAPNFVKKMCEKLEIPYSLAQAGRPESL